ncbi:MAG: hypothetical protein PHE55_10030 [Methylococcaceae bacterium]|nr:hypothetical protein [Methylococcaceae bacterium]
MNSKSYAIACIAALTLLLVFTVAANRIIDPFWYYRDIDIPGLNAARTQFSRYERHIKPIILQRQQPQAVIFGSSFLEIGFDPLHPALTRSGKEAGYNFSMGGASWDLVYCNVIYALEHTDLHLAIIGLHPTAKPKVECKDRGEISQTKLLLSWAALKSSWQTVRNQGKGPSHTPQGRLMHKLHKPETIESTFGGGGFASMVFHYDRRTCLQDPPRAMAESRELAPRWSHPDEGGDLEGLRDLMNRLADKNVAVKFVIYPLHALGQEMAIVCGDVSNRWDYLWRMAGMMENLQAQRGIPIELWDFQGMSAFLTEPIRNRQTRYWQDVGHFNVEMGDKMLDILFSGQDTGPMQEGDIFGIRLSPEAVVRRYDEFYLNRRRFIAANPGFHEALAKLMAPYRQN